MTFHGTGGFSRFKPSLTAAAQAAGQGGTAVDGDIGVVLLTDGEITDGLLDFLGKPSQSASPLA